MQYHTVALLGLASSVLAAPQGAGNTVPLFNEPFGITASGGNISGLYNQVTASRGNLWIGGEQSPTCDMGMRSDFATFVRHSDNSLFLFNPQGPAQQVWIDASGMGQGINGYETAGQDTKPSRATTEGWTISETGVLTFNGIGAKACRSCEAAKYSFWFTDYVTPRGNTDCFDVTLIAYSTPNRLSCIYSNPVQL